MRTAQWTDSTSVLDRITAVFEAFEDSDSGMGVTELARRANLPKSTVSRVASEMVEERLLERDGDKLYLGMRLYEYGQNVTAPRRLRRFALPVMAELRDLTGRTATLGLREGKKIVVVIAVVASTASPIASDPVGTRIPAEASALGRAIAGSSSTADTRAAPVTTVVNERDTGTTHLAVAVISHGRPVAALSLSIPDDADPTGLEPVLRRASSALRHRLSASER